MPHSVFGRSAITAAGIDEDGRSWIEVMPEATEAKNGRFFFTITAEDLSALASYIKANPEKIPIDRDHADAGTRAAGWFTGQARVVQSGDTNPDGGTQDHTSAWAEVQWTPTAVQEIRDGEFRRISPEWTMAKTDKKSGLMTRFKELVAATLTNRPFFDRMAPVRAAVVWSPDEGFEQIRQSLSEALNPGSVDNARFWVMDISGERALVQEYATSKTWVVPFNKVDDDYEPAPLSKWTEARQEWVKASTEARLAFSKKQPFSPKSKTHTTGDPVELKDTLVAALKLDEDADDETILAAIKAGTDENAKLKAEAEKPKIDDETIKQLTASAAKGEQAARDLHDMRRDSLLAEAVREGKILPVSKDAYASMYDVDPENVKTLLDSIPARSFKAIGTGAEGEGELEVEAKSVKIQGTDYPVDGDSAKLNAAARKILADKGKDDFTEAEYFVAVEQAQAQAKS